MKESRNFENGKREFNYPLAPVCPPVPLNCTSNYPAAQLTELPLSVRGSERRPQVQSTISTGIKKQLK